MRNLARVITIFTAFGALAPMAANASGFLTPHNQLVQEINNAYGTQFNVPGQPATPAQGQVAQTRG